MIPIAADYANRIETDLRRNILPFWMEHAVDSERGTFFGAVSNERVPDRSVERGALLTSRILWTFSAAYARYRDPAYLGMAERADADLNGRFHDPAHGGYWWSISGDGTVLRDRKQIYGQAFAIYALSEFHAATGLREALDRAIAVYRLVEAHARDWNAGGYREAFGRAWEPVADMRLGELDQNDPKSQNTHLHVMEAYSRLLQVWPDPGLRSALSDLVAVMLGKIVNAQTGHLGLFFSDDWTLRSDRVSYGHDIEAAWLLCRAADILGEPELRTRIRDLAVTIAEVTLAQGVDSDGGVYNEGGPEGLTNTDKEWWPQAEAIIGFINAHAISGDRRMLEAAFRTWDFVERRLVDRRNGEWFRGVTREGHVLDNQPKVSFWKCPYHNGRTGLEAVHRLRSLGPAGPEAPS